MAKDATGTLSFEQLVRLLGLAAEPADPQSASPGNLLQARLEGTLPLDRRVADALPAVIGVLRRALLPHEGRTLGDALLDPHAPLGLLEAIKAQAKAEANGRTDEASHAVAVTVYYAAIASALRFCDSRITRHGYRTLADAFATLAAKPWMPGSLAEHFTQARSVCLARPER